tara:strand:+ start:1373 stop:1879 length:507 start_codon:yes stop_codon:yes gene_type:complete
LGDPFKFAIDVPIGPDWKNASRLRDGIVNCLGCVFEDIDYCLTIGMAVGELVENAIKYGDWSKSKNSSFTARVHVSGSSVIIEVSNPVRSKSGSVDDLFATLEWIRNQPTALGAYQSLLQKAGTEDGSHLGLARICYETGAQLDASLEGDVIRIRGFLSSTRAQLVGQ